MRYVTLFIYLLLSLISMSCVNDEYLGEDLDYLQYEVKDTTGSVSDENWSITSPANTATYWEPATVSIYNNIEGYNIVHLNAKLYRYDQEIGTISDGSIFNDYGELGHVGNESFILRSCYNEDHCNTVEWNDSIPMSWITYPDYITLDYTIVSTDSTEEDLYVHTEGSLTPRLFYYQKNWTIRLVAFGKGISCGTGNITIKSNLSTI